MKIKEMLNRGFCTMPRDDSFRGRLKRISEITEFCYYNGISMDTHKLQAMMSVAAISYTQFCDAYHAFYADVYDEVKKLGLMESEAKLSA